MHLLSQFVPEENGLLRRKAKRVKNPQSTKVILTVQAMKAAAIDWEQRNPGSQCAGLAAPQIGVNLRIIILRKPDYPRAPQDPERAPIGHYQTEHDFLVDFVNYRAWCKQQTTRSYDPYMVLYNPRFYESDGMQDSEEGCLSVPGVTGETIRPETVTFWFYDEHLKRQPKRFEGPDGKLSAFTCTGHTARVVCHEMDHLNGVLYTDSALRTWETGTKPTEVVSGDSREPEEEAA